MIHPLIWVSLASFIVFWEFITPVSLQILRIFLRLMNYGVFFTTVFLSRNYKEFAWWRKNRVWWCDGVIAWSAWWCNRCYRLKVGVLAGCTKDETYGGNDKPYSPFTLAQCTEWKKIHWTLLIGPAFQPFSTGPRGNETNLWFNPEISDCPDSNLMVS